MDYISIESLMPLSNGVPAHGFDPVTGSAFTEWHVDDDALFHLVVPDRYNPRSDVFLQIDEASLTISSQHAWEITTTLLRPSLCITTTTEAARQTVRLEYASSATCGELTRRTLQATGGASPGCVDSEPLLPGDLLSVVLRRTPASAMDDPLPVRVFNIQAGIQLSEIRISDCPGRLGAIIDSVRDLFNEASQGFLTDEFILRSVNRCIGGLAQDGYWCRETIIPALAYVCEINLLAVIPDVHDIHQVCFQKAEQIMECVGGFREFMSLRATMPQVGRPQFYTVQGATLHVWPPPSSDAHPGFIVFHSYLPPTVHCTAEPYDPPVPRAYDAMLVHFVLKEAFLRDRHSPEANIKFQQYAGLYQDNKQRILGEAAPPTLSLRPAR